MPLGSLPVLSEDKSDFPASGPVDGASMSAEASPSEPAITPCQDALSSPTRPAKRGDASDAPGGGLAPLPKPSAFPGIRSVDEEEETVVGSPPGQSFDVSVDLCEKDGINRRDHINPLSLVPFTDFSQLTEDQLARHLADAAVLEDPPPSVSPRLGEILKEYSVSAKSCAPGHPKSLGAAAFCMDEDCFGRKTMAVIRACVVRFDVFARAEAFVNRVTYASVVQEHCSHKDASCSKLQKREDSETEPSALKARACDSSWDEIVPLKPTRGRALPRSPLLGVLYDRNDLSTSKEIEANDRYIAGAQILAFIPSFLHASIVSLRKHEFEALELEKRQGLFRLHFGAFSPGSISGARRALTRLVDWLAIGGQDDCFLDDAPWLVVSGGLLALFIQDEQSKSKGGSQGGASVASSLRAGLSWAVAHLGCKGLEVKEDVFLTITAPSPAPAKQAVSVTVKVLDHLRSVRSSHPSAIVRYYAAGFELVGIASLRIRDAQRATLSFDREVINLGGGMDIAGYLHGLCYSSKHPKRRSQKKKFFFAPVQAGLSGKGEPDGYVDVLLDARKEWDGEEWDYIFPRVSCPRGGSLASPSVKLLGGPAASHDVIRHFRGILRLAPLSLSAADAAHFSGHSGRHFQVTLGKALSSLMGDGGRHMRYSHDELSLLGDWLEGSMVARYSSEQYRDSKLELLVRLLSDVERILEAARQGTVTLPARGGWGELAAILSTPGRKTRARAAPPDGLLEDEPSDSDSEDESEDED